MSCLSHVMSCLSHVMSCHMYYLFVGKYEENRISQLVFGQHSHQLFSGFADAFPIIAVDNKYQSLSVLKVMPPKGTDLVLSSDVPNGKTYVLILNGLHIKTFGQNNKTINRFNWWQCLETNLTDSGNSGNDFS